MNGLWYALICGIFLLILFIFFDKRKDIKSKLKNRKVKTEKKVEVKVDIKEINEEKKVERTISPKISFEEKNIVVENEEIEVDLGEEPITYQKMGQSMNRSPFPFHFDPNKKRMGLPVKIEGVKEKSIKEQFDELSPEMKAIVMSDCLSKRDDI